MMLRNIDLAVAVPTPTGLRWPLECPTLATRDEEFRRLAAIFWSGKRELFVEIATAMIALDIGLAVQHVVAQRAPFDLVLAADVLYERPGVAQLLELLPKLAPEAWIADPSRPAAEAFFDQAERRWSVETSVHDVISIHRLRRINSNT